MQQKRKPSYKIVRENGKAYLQKTVYLMNGKKVASRRRI